VKALLGFRGIVWLVLGAAVWSLGWLVQAAPSGPPRVLYSNDATNLLNASAFARGDTSASIVVRLHRSIDEAAGADAQMLQPGNGWVPWWKSATYPADEHYRWFERGTGLGLDPFGAFMRDGGDLVAEFVEHCRRRGIAPFVSLRMNDYHGAETHDLVLDALAGRRPPATFRFPLGEASAQSRFQLEHPEFRLRSDPASYRNGTSDERLAIIADPPRRIGLRTARVMNWAIPAVRAQKLSFVRELCEGYDIAGIELDFMRWPALFHPEETTAGERIAIMVEFIREVRSILDRSVGGGARRTLGVRVPSRISGHEPIGVDLRQWVAAGVDWVNLSCHYVTQQQTDLAEIRRSIPRTAVYLELTFAASGALGGGARGYGTITEAELGTAAHLAYARGAAGVSIFNFAYFRTLGGPASREPPFEILARLRDPEWLGRQPQHYFLSESNVPPSRPSDFTRQRHLSVGVTRIFEMDLAPPTGGWRKDATVQLVFKGESGPAKLRLEHNGARLDRHDGRWIVPRARLRPGRNTFAVTLEEGLGRELLRLDLRCPD